MTVISEKGNNDVNKKLKINENEEVVIDLYHKNKSLEEIFSETTYKDKKSVIDCMIRNHLLPPQKPKLFSRDMDVWLILLYMQGKTIGEMQKIVRCSAPQPIIRRLKKCGIRLYSEKELREKILYLFKSGKYAEEIVGILHCEKDFVVELLNEYGVIPYDRQGRPMFSSKK
jgi:hypothetical protein